MGRPSNHYSEKCPYCERKHIVTQYFKDHYKQHFCDRNCYLAYKRKLQLINYHKYISQLSISKEFIHWLAGFVDGEGTFATKLNDKNYPIGFLSFSVAQKEKEIIKYIQQQFRFGKVYRQKTGVFTFNATGYAQCRVLYDYLKPYIRTQNKLKQLKLWEKYFKKFELN